MPKSKWIMGLLACLILAGGVYYVHKEQEVPPAEIGRQALLPGTEMIKSGVPESSENTENKSSKSEDPATFEAEESGVAETAESAVAKTAAPATTEAASAETESTAAEWVFATEALLVNINTAGQAELEKLPGIGPGKARAILQYRQEHGPFQSIEELMQVPGIKEATFAKLKDYVTV